MRTSGRSGPHRLSVLCVNAPCVASVRTASIQVDENVRKSSLAVVSLSPSLGFPSSWSSLRSSWIPLLSLCLPGNGMTTY